MTKSKEPVIKKELQGDFGVWLVIYVELFTFAVIFTGYSIARHNNIEMFNESQLMLNKSAGFLNTVLLITSSWLVMKAVENIKNIYANFDLLRASKYLLLAIASGTLFVVSKVAELFHVFGQGIDLSTNTFFTFYILLALFHLMHVLLGMFILWVLYTNIKKGKYSQKEHLGLESGALYWHMVDLLWIVLFPLVYIMR
jgi:nitric oxide reductase NorE protein